jgi:hypothetical protein
MAAVRWVWWHRLVIPVAGRLRQRIGNFRPGCARERDCLKTKTMTQVVECLLCKFKALSSKPNPTKKSLWKSKTKMADIVSTT